MRLALAFTFGLAVLITWPIALNPAGSLVGHPGNDVWNHVWGFWWVKEMLLQGQIPLKTHLIGYPREQALFFIDNFSAIATLPIQLLFGPVVAYNAAVFGAYWMIGFGAWAFARHFLAKMIGDGPKADQGALLAAVVYASSPHLMAQCYNGITETMHAGFLPLGLLGMQRLYERPGWRRAIIGGSGVALCMLANWYYGMFCMLGAGILLVSHVLFQRERTYWRGIPLSLGLSGGLTIMVVAPVLSAFASTLDSADAAVSRDREFVWKQLVTHNVTDLITLFHPGKFYSPDLKALHGEDLLIVVYLGWSLMALSALGLFSLRRWRDRIPWIAWVLFFGSMMLGPYLYVNGKNVLLDGRWVPLPFLLLFDTIPLFERISHPFRFVVPVQLGLGVLASLGWLKLPTWGRPVVVAVVLAEALLASPGPWPIARSPAEIPDYAEVLKADTEPGAVLDLPLTVPNLERAVYLYWQTAHGRPSPYSLNDPMPRVVGRSHLMRAILVAEAGRINRLPPNLAQLDLEVSRRSMAGLGFRYIVLHAKLYPPDRLKLVETLLTVTLGPPTTTTPDGARIWRLEKPESWEDPS